MTEQWCAYMIYMTEQWCAYMIKYRGTLRKVVLRLLKDREMHVFCIISHKA